MSIKTDLAVCGIYSIKHIASGKEYIGSSINIKTRANKHRQLLVRGAHHSPYLQRVFDKHGQDALTIEVLVICDPLNLLMYEQRFIDGLAPVFNGSKSASSPVQRGQKLPEQWRERAQAAVRKRYADGFTVIHPPRSKEYRAQVSIRSKTSWADAAKREKMTLAINSAMTDEERKQRALRTKTLWEDPEYRRKAVEARIGRAFNKGYKCTPEQIDNRRKAARISNAKRHHKENWKDVYLQRYPEHAGDLNA